MQPTIPHPDGGAGARPMDRPGHQERNQEPHGGSWSRAGQPVKVGQWLVSLSSLVKGWSACQGWSRADQPDTVGQSQGLVSLLKLVKGWSAFHGLSRAGQSLQEIF